LKVRGFEALIFRFGDPFVKGWFGTVQIAGAFCQVIFQSIGIQVDLDTAGLGALVYDPAFILGVVHRSTVPGCFVATRLRDRILL
jgi:hypothetical protein